MVSSSNIGLLVEFELNFKGFDVQRETGRLKSATIVKERVEFSWFLDTERLRDGWEQVEEDMQRENEFVFH